MSVNCSGPNEGVLASEVSSDDMDTKRSLLVDNDSCSENENMMQCLSEAKDKLTCLRHSLLPLTECI